MKLLIGDTVYRIHFRYGRYDGRRETRAEIHTGECVDSHGSICGARPYGVGFAFCNHQDEFVKAKGRKIALARAMTQFYDADHVRTDGLHRGIRTLLWYAYLDAVHENVRR